MGGSWLRVHQVFRMMQAERIPQDSETESLLDALKVAEPAASHSNSSNSNSQSDTSGGGSIIGSVLFGLVAAMASLGGAFAASEAGITMIDEQKSQRHESERSSLAEEYAWTEKEMRVQQQQVHQSKRKLNQIKEQIKKTDEMVVQLTAAEAAQGAKLTEQATQTTANAGGGAFGFFKSRMGGKTTDRATEREHNRTVLTKAYASAERENLDAMIEQQQAVVDEKQQQLILTQQELTAQAEAFQAASRATNLDGQKFMTNCLVSIGKARQQYLEPQLSESVADIRKSYDDLMNPVDETPAVMELSEPPAPPQIDPTAIFGATPDLPADLMPMMGDAPKLDIPGLK